jgi:MFS family permease
VGDGNAVRQSGGWYYGWTIVAAIVLSQVAANSLSYNSFPQFVPVWAAEMHTLPSRFQLSIMAMLVGAAPSSVLVGIWADRYPAWRLYAAGLIGMALFYFGVSLATQPWQIIALYGLVAAPTLTLCTAVTANALISRWFVRQLGTALGISTCGVGLAGTVLPKLVAHFLPDVGWRMIWRIGALLVVAVVLPIVLLVIRDRPSERHGLHYLTVDGTPPVVAPHGHGSIATASKLGWRDVMARRNFWLLVAIYLVMIGTGTAFIQNMGILAKSRGLGVQDTGTLIAMVGIAHVFAALAMGALADRFGIRVPLAGMALAVACGIGFLAVGHSLPVMALGAGLIGLNAAVFTPLSSGIATEFGAQDFGKAFGLAMLFLPLSQIFPYVVARQQEATGSYLMGMAGCAAMLVLIAGLSLMLKEKGRGSRVSENQALGLKA